MLAEMPKEIHHLSGEEIERKKAIGSIATKTLSYLTQAFVSRGFNWLLPVVLSRVTDPLWPDPQASIEKRVEVEIYGREVRAMQSMIVHKITACSLLYDRLFTLSPNIRIERRDRAATGIHSYEFTQLDFEVRHASSRDIMNMVEDLLCGLITHLRVEAKEELKLLDRDLSVPERPFHIYEVTGNEKEFCWVVNMPREFYDFEDFDTGKWDNYDLYLPGFGEVLSGSRREYEYHKIIHKMERDGVRKESYKAPLELAKSGRIKPTAGAGIGIERLIAWICGSKHVCEVQPFPRIPGFVGEL
ncbi:MAG: asparagine synthetase A [Candidatus Thermoplasmatota archaeon]|nr:asparagine synthetase A [Candidatus Thermoplasmatota archaeon]